MPYLRSVEKYPYPQVIALQEYKRACKVVGQVFSGTEFKSFGVELNVRAMVDDKDRITLDLNPVISATRYHVNRRNCTKHRSSLNSSAFNTRSMQTSTRLKDGQPLYYWWLN
ncbi:hypothetical protein P4S63_24040 [Pseudoalteromonas sp. B193]